MPQTIEVLTIKSVTFRNNIGMLSMWQYGAVNGMANCCSFCHPFRIERKCSRCTR